MAFVQHSVLRQAETAPAGDLLFLDDKLAAATPHRPSHAVIAHLVPLILFLVLLVLTLMNPAYVIKRGMRTTAERFSAAAQRDASSEKSKVN